MIEADIKSNRGQLPNENKRVSHVLVVFRQNKAEVLAEVLINIRDVVFVGPRAVSKAGW